MDFIGKFTNLIKFIHFVKHKLMNSTNIGQDVWDCSLGWQPNYSQGNRIIGSHLAGQKPERNLKKNKIVK